MVDTRAGLLSPKQPGEEVGIVRVELGVVEHRYDAVKAVLDGRATVTEVADPQVQIFG
jgi:hypothetical protein